MLVFIANSKKVLSSAEYYIKPIKKSCEEWQKSWPALINKRSVSGSEFKTIIVFNR